MKKEKDKISFGYNIKLYWGLLRNYKPLIFGTLFFVLLLEIASVSDRFLFKILIDRSTDFEKGVLLLPDFMKIMVILMLVFAFTLILRVVGKWMHIHLINKLDAYLISDLKRKFFNHLIYLSHSFHVSHKTGSMISRLSRGGRSIEGITDTIVFNFAPLIFQLGVAGVSLMVFDFTSMIVTSGIIIVFLIYNFFSQKIQESSNVRANDIEDMEKAAIGDIFTNIDGIKYFGKEESIKSKFFRLTENTRKAFLKNWDYFRWLDAGQFMIVTVGTFLLMYFSIQKFLVGELSLGTIVFIYTIYLNLMGPLYSFTHGMRQFYRVMADFESLFKYAKIEQEVKDKSGAKSLKIHSGEIDFKDVSFNYKKRTIFKDLNIKIKKHEKVALVGHSGCGKTTLIKLLYRFYDVGAGAILIDGKDIRDFKQESLRSEMSIVPQECVLFDDTIYNNIAFSNPGATREEVMRAIKFAQLDKIMSSLPQKEKTVVGERGVKLSGGEKQRVSIARAILANRKILVLDEATSSLDSETEYEIKNDLDILMEGRTSIIIAHRLSTIMKADRIIVMKKGKVIQMGTHEQLIKQDGEYKKLWNLQKGGYIA